MSATSSSILGSASFFIPRHLFDFAKQKAAVALQQDRAYLLDKSFGRWKEVRTLGVLERAKSVPPIPTLPAVAKRSRCRRAPASADDSAHATATPDLSSSGLSDVDVLMVVMELLLPIRTATIDHILGKASTTFTMRAVLTRRKERADT